MVESILDEIPQVTACGETTLIVNSIENAATKCQANFREMINAPTQPQLIALQKNYFKQIEQRYSPNKFFIDKTVNCHEFVGLKALAFPGAKFIYTYKKPIEAWLSLYRQKFMVGTHTYSYHAKRCALMIKLSDLYMTYWKSIFPEQIYFFSYENSIEQGSLAWQSLFEWLGFEWHDDYMNFYQNSRKVNTLSASQVREKINSQYVNRSNKYAQLLDDIRVLLELPIEELVK